MAGFLKNALDPLGLTVDDDMGTAFITSGTSAVGYRVATGLLDAGYKSIRVGVWKGPRQDGVDESVGDCVRAELEEKNATVIHYDWTDEKSYTMALAGVNSVFCTIPHTRASHETFASFVKACRTAGVEHFVKVSFYSVQDDNNEDPYQKLVPYVQFHHKCDKELTQKRLDSRMTYTLLRTSHLMSTPLIQQGPVLRDEHKYITASYAMGVNYVSPTDVAKAGIVSLVNRKEHRNKIYNLTGTKPIRDKDVAKLLSKFYGDGERIEHVAIGYHEMEDELSKRRKFPAWHVKDIACFEKVKASGIEEQSSAYSTDLEELIGKNKRETFAQYLENKGAMTLQENPARTEF